MEKASICLTEAKTNCENVSSNNAFELMKTRLKEYKSLNRDIDNNIERLERIESKMYSAASPNLSGMPKAQVSSTDRFANLIARKDELKSEIEGLMVERDKEKKDIEIIVKALKNPDERAVINMRYFDSATWGEITEMLFGVMPDFEENIDNYKQRVFRLHSSAILKMSKVRAVG